MGNDKKIRMCVVCRRGQPAGQMVRVVRKPGGGIDIDASGKADGRGAYVCRTKECMEAAVKKRAFNRAFRQAVENRVYETLESIAGDNGQKGI